MCNSFVSGHRGCSRLSAEEGGGGVVLVLHQMLPPPRAGAVSYLGPLRRRNASCVRTAVFVFVVTFLWLQLHMANIGSSGGNSGGKHISDPSADSAAATQQLLKLVPPHLHKYLLGRNESAAGNSSETTQFPPPQPLNISMIQRSIETLNMQQLVHNEDMFGPLHNDSLVIVVQVRLFGETFLNAPRILILLRTPISPVIIAHAYTFLL
jgi:hypothetical protein